MAQRKFIDLAALGLYDAKLKTYIGQQIAGASHLKFQKVSALPAIADAKADVIYLLARGNAGQQSADIFDEYFLIDGQFELIGNTTVDFSDYSTTEQMNTAIGVAKGEAISSANEHSDGLATAIRGELAAEAKRAGDAESALSGRLDTVEGVIDDLGNNYDEKGAADAVKTAVDAYTINGKKISENPVLSGADIKVAADGDKTVSGAISDLQSGKVDKVEGSRLMTNAEGEAIAAVDGKISTAKSEAIAAAAADATGKANTAEQNAKGYVDGLLVFAEETDINGLFV